MDISGPVAILLFFLLLLVDMFFYGFDAAIDNLNEKEKETLKNEKEFLRERKGSPVGAAF
mgnify:CR=1 FL=1